MKMRFPVGWSVEQWLSFINRGGKAHSLQMEKFERKGVLNCVGKENQAEHHCSLHLTVDVM